MDGRNVQGLVYIGLQDSHGRPHTQNQENADAKVVVLAQTCLSCHGLLGIGTDVVVQFAGLWLGWVATAEHWSIETRAGMALLRWYSPLVRWYSQFASIFNKLRLFLFLSVRPSAFFFFSSSLLFLFNLLVWSFPHPSSFQLASVESGSNFPVIEYTCLLRNGCGNRRKGSVAR